MTQPPRTNLYPLKFKPVYKDYVWGGDRIVRTYKRPMPPGIYAESWEIAEHRDGMSVVANGPMAGTPLDLLVKRMGAELLGSKPPPGKFPLLVKLIDSRERLSVQVHPDDASAARYGGDAKTEMWYILDADADAQVFAGLRPGVDRTAFERAIETGRFAEILVAVPVRPGDAVLMRGGRVHAIDAGCLILEVQQNSNTTYRVYDWGRVGPDGKPRALHIREAMQVINWGDAEDARARPRQLGSTPSADHWEILTSPYFRLEKLVLRDAEEMRNDGSSFHVLFGVAGNARIRTGTTDEGLRAGECCLLPAAIASYELVPEDGTTDILRISVP